MSGIFQKAPDSQLEFVIEWQGCGLGRDARVTGDLGWSVQPAELASDDLRVVSQTHDGAVSRVVLEGGRIGQSYMVTARVETSGARVLSRSMLVTVGGT